MWGVFENETKNRLSQPINSLLVFNLCCLVTFSGTKLICQTPSNVASKMAPSDDAFQISRMDNPSYLMNQNCSGHEDVDGVAAVLLLRMKYGVGPPKSRKRKKRRITICLSMSPNHAIIVPHSNAMCDSTEATTETQTCSS